VRRRRQLIVALVVLVGVAVGHGAADACKHRGKMLFKEETGPLPATTDSVPNAQLEIYATGAWGRVQEMPDGQEPASQGGCLSKRHLAELKRALKRAKFEVATDRAVCDEVPTSEVIYASPMRRRKVRTERPCGQPVDDGTALLADCAELAARARGKSAGEIRAVCRGEAAP
jgi:hypothetical protein